MTDQQEPERTPDRSTGSDFGKWANISFTVLTVVATLAVLDKSQFILAGLLVASAAMSIAAYRWYRQRPVLMFGGLTLAVAISVTAVILFAKSPEELPSNNSSSPTEPATAVTSDPATVAPTTTVGPTSSSNAPIPPADPPFDVAVRRIPSPCVSGWVVPAKPGDFNEPSYVATEDERNSWADSVEAIPASTGIIELNIQGKTSAQVTLLGIEIKIAKKSEPLPGTQVSVACGGGGVYRWMNILLDRTPPLVTTEIEPDWDHSVPAHERKPIRFPYRVSIEDAETFLVYASTENCDCTWEVLLRWSSQGKTGTHTISKTSDGQLLRTTSAAGVEASCMQTGDSFDCE